MHSSIAKMVQTRMREASAPCQESMCPHGQTPCPLSCSCSKISNQMIPSTIEDIFRLLPGFSFPGMTACNGRKCGRTLHVWVEAFSVSYLVQRDLSVGRRHTILRGLAILNFNLVFQDVLKVYL